MASAAIQGYNAQLFIVTPAVAPATTPTTVKVGEIRDVSLKVESDTIEVTTHDSNGWRKFLPGLKQWSGSAEGLYIATDAGQEAVYDALVGGTVLKFRFIPKAGTGLDQWEGDGYIKSWDLSGPNDDVSAVSIEFQGSGEPAKTAQV